MLRSKALMSALLLAVVFLSAFCAISSPLTESDAMPMPNGLENVRLGMSVDELKKARPSLRRDDFPESPLYEETALPNEFFSYAGYEFAEGRLAKVTLSQSSDPVGVQGKCRAFFKGAIQKWGVDYSRMEGIIEKHPVTGKTYSYPVLYWEKPGARIAARCVVSSDEKYAPNFDSLLIFYGTLSMGQAAKMKIKDSATPAELDKVFKDVLVENVKEPLFR